MLVTIERYRAITGDSASTPAMVTARIELATEELADVLDRPLEHGEYTEALQPTRDGRLWPRATPIMAAEGWTIDGLGLIGSGPFLTEPFVWPHNGSTVSVTYEGGWIERSANPSAANRLPTCIERDLAIAAYVIGHPASLSSVIPAGATSVHLGDASVSFGPDGAPSGGLSDQLRRVWSRRTLGYRYRVERGVPACS